jgi:hypothetical protein
MTVLFSVEPSQSPSGILTPSVLTPSARTQQRPFSSIPSSINAARRTSESGRAISAARCSPVRATNSRLTVDFDVERSAALTASPTGSRVLANPRVQTPASICSSTTFISGSRSAKYAYVASATSCSPSALRARGYFTVTRRPPSITEPSSWPSRTALRSFTVACLEPTTSSSRPPSSRSARPARHPHSKQASPPSRRRQALQAPPAPRGGSPPERLSCSCITVFMAVPFVSMD